MADFTPINTQEELDALIQTAVDSATSRFADYDQIKATAETAQSALAKAQATLQTNSATVDELQAKIALLEQGAIKTKVASDLGLPIEMSSRLVGTTEEEIKADAQRLQKIILAMSVPTIPMGSAEPAVSTNKNSDDAALLALLRQMKGDN